MAKSELNANQKKALAALLSEPTVKSAAERCGLSERTVYYYLADETFGAELRARQDAILSSVTASLVGLSGEAVRVLREVLSDPKATASVKVRASLGLLQNTRATVELADLVDRVSRLEEKIGGGK